MGFNLDKVTVCRNCGALVLPDMAEKHAEFHQAIVTLTEAVQSVNDMALGINRNVGQLAQVMKDRLALDLMGGRP